jgi:hypothetical protein
MKATAATIRARVDGILGVMLDGAMPFQVRQFVAEREAAGEAPWMIPEGGKPLSERQIRRYCDQADALTAEANRTNRKKRLRRHVARRHQLYARAVNAGDYRTALAIDQDLATLQGLYPAKKTELTGKDGGPMRIDMDIEALRNLPPEELLRLHRQALGLENGSGA